MDFGRLEYQELELIDFKLPSVKSFLRPTENCSLSIGTPIWAADAFRGTIYPEDARKKDYLSIYASQFSTLEVNSTFYALPALSTVASWVNEVRSVNPHFKFCPKVSKSISHEGRLDGHFDIYPHFFDILETFGDHLGISFLQLHESFSPLRLGELINFIEFWPKKYKLAVELRHPGWFKAGPLHDRILEILKAHNVSMVVTDTPGNQAVLHQNLTARHLLIRFVVTSYHPKDRERTQAWAKRLMELRNYGASEIYFIAHERNDSLYLKTLRELALQVQDEFEIKVPIDHSEKRTSQLSFF